MTLILAIESSTSVCSVALFDGLQLMSIREVNEGYNHAALLTRFIQEVLEEKGYHANQLSAVAVSKGPGSYTGLRIGVSAAKGVCFAHHIPLIGVSALEAMALHLAEECNPDDYFIPMIDAGRMEVYTMIFDGTMRVIEPLGAKIISRDSFDNLPSPACRYLTGNGAFKFRDLFSGDRNVVIRDDVLPSARLLGKPALSAFSAQQFENVAYFEPLYLKEFIAEKPRVKGLF